MVVCLYCRPNAPVDNGQAGFIHSQLACVGAVGAVVQSLPLRGEEILR